MNQPHRTWSLEWDEVGWTVMEKSRQTGRQFQSLAVDGGPVAGSRPGSGGARAVGGVVNPC